MADDELMQAVAVLQALAQHPITRVPESRGSTGTTIDFSQQKYQLLLEQIPAVTFSADLEGGLTDLYVSPQIERLLGFTQSEWLEDPVRWYRHLHDDDKARWNVDFAQVVISGEAFEGVYRFVAKSGRVVWVQGAINFIRDEAGRPRFLQGVAFDITEIKEGEAKTREAERVLREAKENLEIQVAQRTAELESFARVVSHDLQAPLRRIFNYTHLLQDAVEKGAQGDLEKYGARILDSAGRMRALISDLLKYSRVSSSTEAEEVDLGSVIAEICSDFGAQLEESGAEISFSALPRVTIRRVHMRQLFQNLIGNAIKYRRAGVPPRVEVSVVVDDDHLRGEVRDNGIGIPPEMAAKVFKVFQRLHSEDEYEGTGIGLSIVQKIVELYGGEITVQPNQPEGSRFRFSLRLP